MKIWDSRDVARLRRIVSKCESQSEAARRLEIGRDSLSRYLAGARKPSSNLAVSALRSRMLLVLSQFLEAKDSCSRKDAGS